VPPVVVVPLGSGAWCVRAWALFVWVFGLEHSHTHTAHYIGR
jgi:hypothetical protein